MSSFILQYFSKSVGNPLMIAMKSSLLSRYKFANPMLLYFSGALTPERKLCKPNV